VAIIVNSDASAFKRSANLPSATAYTMWGWFMLTTDRNTWTGLLGLTSAVDASTLHELGTDTDGVTCKVWNASGSTTIATLSLNTWYFAAMSCSGTGAGALVGYIRAITANTLTSASRTGSTFTPGQAEWGRDCFTGEYLDGRMHACGMANAVLSADELLEISYYHEPQKDGIRSINVFYPCVANTNTLCKTDMSGNGRNATATEGALADSPGLLWQPPMAMPTLYTAAAGGSFQAAWARGSNVVMHPGMA
jgi:hypothetical protein